MKSDHQILKEYILELYRPGYVKKASLRYMTFKQRICYIRDRVEYFSKLLGVQTKLQENPSMEGSEMYNTYTIQTNNAYTATYTYLTA